MKKAFNILSVLVTIPIIGFIAMYIFGISIMGTETDSEYFEKHNNKFMESTENRILYTYGLGTLNWENYVLKRKKKIVLNKTETDSTINFRFIDPADSLNFANTKYSKKDKSISIVGHKYVLIEQDKYSNESISDTPFNLYDYEEHVIDGNGPFLFNSEYGILNSDVFSAGLQLFFLPLEVKVDIERELLR